MLKWKMCTFLIPVNFDTQMYAMDELQTVLTVQ